MALEQQWQRLDRAQEDNTHLDIDGEEYGSGSYDEDGSCADKEDDRKDRDSEAEEDEPFLKYKRFAKEVVDSLSQGSSHDAQAKNIITYMAIHTKVLVNEVLEVEGAQ